VSTPWNPYNPTRTDRRDPRYLARMLNGLRQELRLIMPGAFTSPREIFCFFFLRFLRLFAAINPFPLARSARAVRTLARTALFSSAKKFESHPLGNPHIEKL
jgi:hypothetical protein